MRNTSKLGSQEWAHSFEHPLATVCIGTGISTQIKNWT